MSDGERREVAVRVAFPGGESDVHWLADLWRAEWNGDIMISKGCVHHLHELETLIAWTGAERVGAATFMVDGSDCELMSINSLAQAQGVGTKLLESVEDHARRTGCERVWLITSNDNVAALRFYQRRGYRIMAVHVGGIDRARKTKPSIPLTGCHGIEIHDEIELEKRL